jgi:TetR/AcrR family transcriptional repressor of nem operon
MSTFEAARNASFSKKRDPLERVYGYIDFMIELSTDASRRSGCLLGNFAQVLADTHPEIRLQCATHFRMWSETLKRELDQAKAAYKVKGLDTGTLADHFIALFEGSLMLAKTRQDLDVIGKNLFHFKKYLKILFKK